MIEKILWYIAGWLVVGLLAYALGLLNDVVFHPDNHLTKWDWKVCMCCILFGAVSFFLCVLCWFESFGNCFNNYWENKDAKRKK